MTTINKLTRADTVNAGDVVPVYIQSQGDARGVAVSVLQEYMQESLTFPLATGMQEYVTQYAAPSSTGFNISITAGSNIHLILTPTAGFATGAITLPPVAGLVDKQDVIVNCTQQVTAFTINGNGATAVTGEPSSLGADDFFRMKYDLQTSTWYRIG
jgi:hypothetical protein